jgi:type IV pilus assembly protein PilN
MRFTINLATRPYLDQRKVRHGCVAVMVLLLALLAWNVSRLSSNLGELRRLGAENADLEARLTSRPTGVSEKEYARLLASIRFYNDVIERKAFSWLGLLDRLENVTPEGVALVSLTPDKRGTELKLDGRAKRFGGVRSYLERLEESRAFTDILLLSHRELALNEGGKGDKGVQFAISCRVVAP